MLVFHFQNSWLMLMEKDILKYQWIRMLNEASTSNMKDIFCTPTSYLENIG